MISNDALPEKNPRSTCFKCGLKAGAPIVVKDRCTNAGACAKRVKIAKKRDQKRQTTTP